MASRSSRGGTGENGQVLVVGILMLLILLIALFFLFDLHNVMRAKFKTETAQQAAALAGADWQRASLNLIGEINLIKAAETLLETDNRWEEFSPLAPAAGDRYTLENAQRLNARLALLTEMQARISFIGPLIGFAAAQQAAKANGLNPVTSLDFYRELLLTDRRYFPEQGGAPEYIHGYRWRLPYLALISAIDSNGVAVYPNARLTGTPQVSPAAIGEEDLYEEILRHAGEIADGAPPVQSHWFGAIYHFVKWSDEQFRGKWWDIDYSFADFPGESEIFTLGLQYDSVTESPWYAGYGYAENSATLEKLLPDETIRSDESRRAWEAVGVQFNWCRYADDWYPDYFRARNSSYDEDHFDYWFGGTALRRPIRPQYVYEGPAAYAEGGVDVGLTAQYSVGGSSSKSADFDARFQERKRDAVHIGSRRTSRSAAAGFSGYRAGAIAKALGELPDETPPIAIPLVLPVFTDVSIMPTYMPLPENFNVLQGANSPLMRFLSWLADKSSLWDNSSPPASTEAYLKLLQHLADGKNFRFYGWNQNFDQAAFDERWRDHLTRYLRERETLVYSQETPDGPGWLQEPKLCGGSETNFAPREERVTDYRNGGTALRIYPGGSGGYYVVDSRGHIITNDESDPTVRGESVGGGGGGGGGWSSGPGSDTMPGPPRL